MHNFTRECQSHWRKNFLPFIHYVATIPCESVGHNNTFHTILALCTCLYRSHLGEPVLMKRTNTAESQRLKIYVQNVDHSREHVFRQLHHCAIAAAMMLWSDSLHSLSRRSSTPLHHGSANGRPSLEGYPRYCSPPGSNLENWVATSLERGDSVTCMVNGMISVTSTLCHQVRDVHGMQHSKFSSTINIHLQSCVPKFIKIHAYL